MVRARKIIYKEFKHLLPLFDMLYYHETHCYYRDIMCSDYFALLQIMGRGLMYFLQFSHTLMYQYIRKNWSKEVPKITDFSFQMFLSST